MLQDYKSGKFFVISGPSGAGKGTIVKALLTQRSDLALSISHTSRAPRLGEVSGREYFFVTKEIFETMINAQGFIEWAKVHDNYYGTSQETVQNLLAAGKHVLFEIDVQGGVALKVLHPDVVSIFILPPSHEVLLQRLMARGTEDEATLKRRLTTMDQELPYAEKYDYTVVNDDLITAIAEVNKIIDKHTKGE